MGTDKVFQTMWMTIIPGFVSMHAHGGGGHDFTEATEEAFRMATTAHLKHGATSMFPVSYTHLDVYKRQILLRRNITGILRNVTIRDRIWMCTVRNSLIMLMEG